MNCCLMQKQMKPIAEVQSTIDPVCGMMVDPNSAKKVHYQGRDYYFCSLHCLKKFEQNPA